MPYYELDPYATALLTDKDTTPYTPPLLILSLLIKEPVLSPPYTPLYHKELLYNKRLYILYL